MAYRVLNPRHIPAGVCILEHEGVLWFEGDTFVKPETMSSEDVQGLVSRGFLEEVS